jgi:RNA polymerase sigma-70 factor, ECF subfamily
MPMKAETERVLLERAREGDRKALDALLLKLEPSVYKFGLKMCRDEETARDVLQETLLATVRNLGSFRGDSSLATWMYSVARSACAKQRRRSKFAPATHEPLETAAEDLNVAAEQEDERPDKSLERAQLRQKLQEAIGSLDPMYGQVILLRDVEGLSAAETAGALELSVEAVKTRLHRARARVREALAPLIEAPVPAGPSCPDVIQLISAKLEGDLSVDRCEEMEKHLATCPHCANASRSLRAALRLCRVIGSAEPPTPAVREAVRAAAQDFIAQRREEHRKLHEAGCRKCDEHELKIPG